MIANQQQQQQKSFGWSCKIFLFFSFNDHFSPLFFGSILFGCIMIMITEPQPSPHIQILMINNFNWRKMKEKKIANN